MSPIITRSTARSSAITWTYRAALLSTTPARTSRRMTLITTASPTRGRSRTGCRQAKRAWKRPSLLDEEVNIMNALYQQKRRRKGVTYIEVLIASLVLAISMAAIVQMWYVSYNLSATDDLKGIAYSIGRRRVEAARETGYYNIPLSPASTTYYYDSTGGSESTTKSSSSLYQATVTVSCDQTTTDSNGNTVVADTGLMTVTVSVSMIGGSSTLYSTTTYLSRAGL